MIQRLAREKPQGTVTAGLPVRWNGGVNRRSTPSRASVGAPISPPECRRCGGLGSCPVASLVPALAAVFQRHIWHVHRADILRERSEQDIIGELFHYLQRPTRHAAHGEDGNKEIFSYPEQIVD